MAETTGSAALWQAGIAMVGAAIAWASGWWTRRKVGSESGLLDAQATDQVRVTYSALVAELDQRRKTDRAEYLAELAESDRKCAERVDAAVAAAKAECGEAIAVLEARLNAAGLNGR